MNRRGVYDGGAVPAGRAGQPQGRGDIKLAAVIGLMMAPPLTAADGILLGGVGTGPAAHPAGLKGYIGAPYLAAGAIVAMAMNG